MQKKITKYNNLVKLFTIFLLLSFLFGCSTGLVVTSKPTIHYFTSSPSTIESGESSTLSWNVTDANSVTIDQGIGPVELSSGTRSVNPTTTTTYTLTATNSAGSVTATTKVVVNLPIKTMTIQPGPSYGKDAFVSSMDPAENYKEYELDIGKSTGAKHRTFIQFDLLSFIPGNAVITNAILRLYQYDLKGTENLSIGAHRVTQEWKEDTITFENQPKALDKIEHSTNITTKPVGGEWKDWYLGDLVQGWLDGSIKNYGILLKAVDETINTLASFRASEYSNPSERPKLVIHYYIP